MLSGDGEAAPGLRRGIGDEPQREEPGKESENEGQSTTASRKEPWIPMTTTRRHRPLPSENRTGRDTVEESSALWRLARPVLERYERYLEETDTVDHEGTILKAWRYLRDGAVTPPGRRSWSTSKEVNPAQAAFVHALLRPRGPGRPSTRARLTAVGDDWQAIFGFQGGDVELIRELNDPAGDHERTTERIELRQTLPVRLTDHAPQQLHQPCKQAERRRFPRLPGRDGGRSRGPPQTPLQAVPAD